MARRARSYTRDARGRFASTPGGGAKPKPPRTSFRQRQAVSLARGRGQTGRLGSATKAAKARLKATRARTGAGASPQQKAALTRAKRMAAALAGERRVKTAQKAGVVKGRVKRDPGVGAKLGAVRRKTIQGEQARKDRAEMAADRKREAKQLLAMPKAARRAIQTARTARRGLTVVAGRTSALLQNIEEGRMQLARNYGKRKDKLSPKAIASITESMQGSASKLRTIAAEQKTRNARPTSKVVPRSERRKVAGPRKAGVVAKPKGLKPGALAERRGRKVKTASLKTDARGARQNQTRRAEKRAIRAYRAAGRSLDPRSNRSMQTLARAMEYLARVNNALPAPKKKRVKTDKQIAEQVKRVSEKALDRSKLLGESSLALLEGAGERVAARARQRKERALANMDRLRGNPNAMGRKNYQKILRQDRARQKHYDLAWFAGNLNVRQNNEIVEAIKRSEYERSPAGKKEKRGKREAEKKASKEWVRRRLYG